MTRRNCFLNFVYNCAKKNKKGINIITEVKDLYCEHYKTVKELEDDTNKWKHAPGLEESMLLTCPWSPKQSADSMQCLPESQ